MKKANKTRTKGRILIVSSLVYIASLTVMVVNPTGPLPMIALYCCLLSASGMMYAGLHALFR